MKYKNRKHLQRALNRELRKMNTSLREDDLWLGRFEVRQIRAGYEHWSDGSGGILYATVRMVDKATGYYKDNFIEVFCVGKFYPWHLWEKMNKFIIEDSGAWGNGRPDAENYLNKKVPDEIWTKPYNWHVSEKYWDNGRNVG